MIGGTACKWVAGIGQLALIIIALLVNAPDAVECNDNLSVAYEWRQIDFDFGSDDERREAIASKRYVPEHVIPVGLEVYKSRLFMTLPRWKSGVPASIVYLDLNDNRTKSPVLKPYPNWSAHRVTGDDRAPDIVSPFRIRADRCGRLWVLDTGCADLLEEKRQLAPTSLLVYDLETDNLMRRFEFPSNQVKHDSFFANIAVEDAICEDTYAYAGDLGAPGLVVYSWSMDKSWRVQHHYFYPDPLAGNYSIQGVNFQWNDGLFGLAISKAQTDGFATIYFHPLSSTNEFSVSTSVLRNETLATSKDNYRMFKILGTRGLNGQSGAAFLDQLTGVLFYALPNLNAVACWKTSNKAYTIKSQGRVYMSPVEMVFPNDVKVDDQDRLWVLSDRLQQFIFASLDPKDVNFRILTAHVKDAIDHTACDTKTKPLPDLINRLGDILRPQNTQNTNGAPHNFASLIVVLCSSTLSYVVLANRHSGAR